MTVNGVFLMPCEPGCPRRIDLAWTEEYDLLRHRGASVLLVDHDALVADDPYTALRHTGLGGLHEMGHGTLLIYRGWMMTPKAYAGLHEAVRLAGATLLDDPQAYGTCHHLPESLPFLGHLMAPTRVLPMEGMGSLDAWLLSMDGVPQVLRDYEKSEAGLWHEACLIPDPGDLDAARKVVDRFLELRGNWFSGGLVCREHLPLVQNGGRALEWRAFVVDGRVCAVSPRSTGDGDGIRHAAPPPATMLSEAASLMPARFWCMDWAVQEDGRHVLLEAGHGGVSEVPQGGMEAVVHALEEAFTVVPPLGEHGTPCLHMTP